jgi:hypothetical protein
VALLDVLLPLSFFLIADHCPQQLKIEGPTSPQFHRAGNLTHGGLGLDDALLATEDGNRIVNATTLRLRHFTPDLLVPHRAATSLLLAHGASAFFLVGRAWCRAWSCSGKFRRGMLAGIIKEPNASRVGEAAMLKRDDQMAAPVGQPLACLSAGH